MKIFGMLSSLSGSFFIEVEFLEHVVDHSIDPFPSEYFILFVHLVHIVGSHSLTHELLQDGFIHLIGVRGHISQELVYQLGRDHCDGDEDKDECSWDHWE